MEPTMLCIGCVGAIIFFIPEHISPHDNILLYMMIEEHRLEMRNFWVPG
jgi:hypothetical protein